jgi:hypothetical protein
LAKGNIAIIDGIAALLVVSLLCGIIAYYEPNEGLQQLRQGVEKENLRIQFYDVLFSGGILSLVQGETSHLEVNGIIIDSNPPSNGTFLKFFISNEWGVREFYVYEKG